MVSFNTSDTRWIFPEGLNNWANTILGNVSEYYKNQFSSVLKDKKHNKNVGFVDDIFNSVINGKELSEKEKRKMVLFLKTSTFWDELYNYLDSEWTVKSVVIDITRFFIILPLLWLSHGAGLGVDGIPVLDRIALWSWFWAWFKNIKDVIIDKDKKEIKSDFKQKVIDRIQSL